MAEQSLDVPALDIEGSAAEPRKGEVTPKPVEKKLYDGKRLTREGMRQTLLNGGSVMYNGRIIFKHQDLPTELELAGEDEAKKKAALAKLKAQRAALDAQIKGATEV